MIDGGGGLGVLNIQASTTLGNLTVTGARHGAAIDSRAAKLSPSLVLNHVVVRDNTFVDDTGAGGLYMGGGSVRIENSVFAHNTGLNAGALESDGGSLTIVDSEFDDYLAPRFVDGAGAIMANGAGLDIEDSRLTGNSGSWGSALDAGTTGAPTVVNSTIDANVGATAGGGAIVVDLNHGLTLTNDSIIGNQCGGLGGALDQVVVGNSVLASNINGSCTGGPPHSVGHNVADDRSCELSCPGDRQAIDPLLGPVADNGGPTFTPMPAPGSPLLDAADFANCPPVDERGVSRPQGPGCDIGAVEREFVAAPVAPPPAQAPPPAPAPTPAPTVQTSHHGRWVTTARFTLPTRAGTNERALPAAVQRRLRRGSYRLLALGARAPFRVR